MLFFRGLPSAKCFTVSEEMKIFILRMTSHEGWKSKVKLVKLWENVIAKSLGASTCCFSRGTFLLLSVLGFQCLCQ